MSEYCNSIRPAKFKPGNGDNHDSVGDSAVNDDDDDDDDKTFYF